MENAVLNSWKEIAAYTGRGIRTLQRWEQELGFPVRRPRGRQRSAVVAVRHEIDLWMRSPHGAETNGKAHHIRFETHARLRNNTEVLQLQTAILVRQGKVLAERLGRAMALVAAVRTSSKTGRSEEGNSDGRG